MLQPNRTYYLEDPQGYALEWCQILDEVRARAYETPAVEDAIGADGVNHPATTAAAAAATLAVAQSAASGAGKS